MSSHDTHDHAAHDHGTIRSYVTGFVLAVILTVIPFYVVMTGGLPSRDLTVFVVLATATVQIVVHMYYFLHMKPGTEGGWSMISLIFTLIILGIMLAGSVWVMYHLNANMMPMQPDM
ncbi:cytochrome bo3 quinol oxidase subunit 4 [Loktanella atrilutea]|uniref:Cytochrome bo(3) ubiquinol oxidase subunit 4 n=1 Tax=Loktanella atrilutea TaxID=366533 RepID=A0A1M4SPA4_LOKAT|nr:cytochrome o ubiquinol oxidase subunit IV [Loktanella atrilutea]SHE33777.1 cytochrome bo3 quinol oxidase subunit 4 [Loktanella atrilutea]